VKIAIIGGGAAGYFTAVHLSEKTSKHQIQIFEKGKSPLQKVLVSGGGRCNVTHACFIPRELSSFYPRGGRELMGPFSRFMTGDTMEWFEQRGVPLKIEDDNRIFPVSNSSKTIIDTLTQRAKACGVKLNTGCTIVSIDKVEKGFVMKDQHGKTHRIDVVVFTPGSSPKSLGLAKEMGLSITSTHPSLFTFRTPGSPFVELSGVTLEKVDVQIIGLSGSQKGPLLFTHRGLSGPAILKTSAYKALELSEANYRFSVLINFLPHISEEDILEEIIHSNKKLKSLELPLPKRLVSKLIEYAGFSIEEYTMGLHPPAQKKLVEAFTKCQIKVEGKDTFKEEFVTAGGVELKEINFKTFEAKKIPNLFLGGEVLNIDAVTGGFNFQAAWTAGFHIAECLAERE